MNTLRAILRMPAARLADGVRWMLAGLVVTATLNGCAAFHPIRGVPAPYVPHEYLGPSRSGRRTINPVLLTRTQPDQYRVAAEDVLAVYIPGVLGSVAVEEEENTIGETPPINLSTNPLDPPTIGYPVTVRDDGTISLPYIDPVNVNGMTLPEIERALRRVYTKQTDILNSEHDRVMVSLARKREVRVLVVRQETSGELTQGSQQGTLNIGNSQRGTAHVVRLPGFENDVLHALASSVQGADGLPGLNAKNVIYIIRRKQNGLDDSYSLHDAPAHEMGESFTPTRDDASSSAPVSPQPDTPTITLPPTTPTAPQAAPPNPTTTEPTPIQQRPVVPTQPRTAPPSFDRTPDSTLPLQTPAPDLRTPDNPQPDMPTTPRPNRGSDVPIWPAPAQPSTTIQRTSGAQRAVGQRQAWPTIRGQSPSNSWGGGHSSSYGGSGQSLMAQTSPYPAQQLPVPAMPQMQPGGPLFGHSSPPPGGTMPTPPYGEMNAAPLMDMNAYAQPSMPPTYPAQQQFHPAYSLPPSMPQPAYDSMPQNYGYSMSPQGVMTDQYAPPSSMSGQMGYGHDAFYGPGTAFGHEQSYGAESGAAVPGNESYSVGGHDHSWRTALSGFDPTVDNPNVIKIPVRLADGERPTFTERDVILEDGDIIFIESRETEVFYTGGLLGGGQYTLPRDYDLRVLEAISIAQSPRNNTSSGSNRSIGGVSALNQDVTISASHVVILRTLPNGTRIPIEIDLYKAVRRPEENLIVQPGDLVILQYTKFEAVGAFIERHILDGAVFGIAAAFATAPAAQTN